MCQAGGKVEEKTKKLMEIFLMPESEKKQEKS